MAKQYLCRQCGKYQRRAYPFKHLPGCTSARVELGRECMFRGDGPLVKFVDADGQTVVIKAFTRPGEIFHAKMKGFYTGAGVKVLDPRFEDPKTPQHIRDAYKQGYEAGIKARCQFAKKLEKETGYTPSVLRAG
jgi:hypothetical protein